MMNICVSAASFASTLSSALGESETQKPVSDARKARCFVSDQAGVLPHKSPEPKNEAERKPADQA